MNREPEKKKPVKKSEKKKDDKKKKKLSPEEKEKERKKEEVVVPAIMFAAIIIVMVFLIYASFKSNDVQKAQEQRLICSRQLMARVAPVLAAYRQEKGDYPETIEDLKDFLSQERPGSDTATPGGSPAPASSSSPGGSPAVQSVPAPVTGQADIEKNLADVWKYFYCPEDTDKSTPGYTYQKPAPDSPGDFVVMKCRIHGDASSLKLDALRNLESQGK